MDAVVVGGLRVAFERVGRGPAVVLLQGYVGDGSATWRPQLDALADEFSVVALGRAGRGSLGRPSRIVRHGGLRRVLGRVHRGARAAPSPHRRVVVRRRARFGVCTPPSGSPPRSCGRGLGLRRLARCRCRPPSPRSASPKRCDLSEMTGAQLADDPVADDVRVDTTGGLGCCVRRQHASVPSPRVPSDGSCGGRGPASVPGRGCRADAADPWRSRRFARPARSPTTCTPRCRTRRWSPSAGWVTCATSKPPTTSTKHCGWLRAHP